MAQYYDQARACCSQNDHHHHMATMFALVVGLKVWRLLTGGHGYQRRPLDWLEYHFTFDICEVLISQMNELEFNYFFIRKFWFTKTKPSLPYSRVWNLR